MITIRLRHKVTGVIRYLSKSDGYPIAVGDELRLKHWHDNQDIWIVEKITVKKGQHE